MGAENPKGEIQQTGFILNSMNNIHIRMIYINTWYMQVFGNREHIRESYIGWKLKTVKEKNILRIR